jgi:hypothetical protein
MDNLSYYITRKFLIHAGHLGTQIRQKQGMIENFGGEPPIKRTLGRSRREWRCVLR